MNSKKINIAFAIIANIIFGLSFLFSKYALTVTDGITLIAVRFTVASVIMSLLWVFGAIKMNFKKKNIFSLLLMGLAQPFLYFIFEPIGIENTTSAFSGVMLALVPVAAMILSAIFIHERPTSMQVLFAFISLAGVALVSFLDSSGGAIKPVGIICLLGAVLSAAAFNLLSRNNSAEFSASERTYIMFLLAAVLFNCIAVIRGGYVGKLGFILTDAKFLICIGYLAILSSIAAFLLYNHAITYIDVTTAASTANIITVVSVAAGAFIAKEPFNLYQLLSVTLIITGVFGVSKYSA